MEGVRICQSGAFSNRLRCGQLLGPSRGQPVVDYQEGGKLIANLSRTSINIVPGDSGGPTLFVRGRIADVQRGRRARNATIIGVNSGGGRCLRRDAQNNCLELDDHLFSHIGDAREELMRGDVVPQVHRFR